MTMGTRNEIYKSRQQFFSQSLPANGRPTATSDDEEFADATDAIINNYSLNLLDTIKETKITLDLFMSNEFELAEEKMASLADRSTYHALGYGSILFIKAMMTCDRADMERAMEVAQNSAKVIEKFRPKYSITDSIYRIGGSHKPLTDSEIHAELCYAESLMFRAVLTFFYDETFASLVKGAFKIRSCFQSFKECQRILLTENWLTRDPEIKAQFEAGVRMGIGAFNLMLSALPSKIIKLLEVVGFSGNKTIGMLELNIAAMMKDTLRNPLVCMTLLAWNLIACYFIGTGEPDIPFCDQLMAPLVTAYPKGAIVLFLKARLYLVKGDIDNAIYFYNRSIEVQNVYKQFHHVCYWELLFANCYMRKWDRAANHAKRLLEESKWSRCCYTYLLAILIDADKTAPKRGETVKYLLDKIPKIRLRIAGKSIPVEKFCERKSLRYHREGRLIYPHYEFLYFWNGFTILANNLTLVRPILEDIEQTWKLEASTDKNDEALYLFLKGGCLKILKDIYQAELCFLKIMENERLITEFSYLVPNTCFELAMVRKELGRSEEVVALLNKALSYKGYSLETKLHFKIHAAMEAEGAKMAN